jgi:hypothetical protein
MERICLSGTLLAALIASAGCSGGGDDDGAVDPECQLDGAGGEAEPTPGFPYDFEVFKSDIAPLLVDNCTAGNCHLPGEPPAGANGGYTVWANAKSDDCERVKTFKAFVAKSDTTTPANSRTLYAINGGLATHPVKVTTVSGGTLDAAILTKLTDYITKARETCVAAGQCQGGGGVDYFDYAAFQDRVQPALDAAGGVGCSSSAACHAPPTGQLGFALNPAPARDSAEMQANYEAVKAKISLDGEPRTTILYQQATVKHGGGVSTTVDATGASAIEDFIAKAIQARGEQGNPGGCANPALLSVDVFEEEILPILQGRIDLNNQGGQNVTTGCTRETCHGVSRPGALTLIQTDPVEKQLENFACFVNLVSPSSSQVLLCPSDSGACIKAPHPGDRIFADADDKNYQRILSYLFSANTDNVPVDFAFYATKIDAIFNNVNAVENGAQGRTCADTNACHGIQVVGQEPPNGSNFGILGGAGENVNRLKANFTEAAAFINFTTPDGSSLFLYPTNEIADVDNNAFATGTVHPGGADFAVDSQFALDILKFAGGLRPDGQGFQLNWLITGAFQGVANVDDEALFNEETILPKIFDQSGGDEQAGQWVGFFSNDQRIDVGNFLTGDAGNGRTAYAVAYIFNATTIQQRVEVELSPENDALLYVGGSQTQINAGNTGSLTVIVPPTRGGATDPLQSRIMIKLFQAADQADMAFQLRLLRADNNQPFTDVGEELFFKLDQVGGL